ncbi:MAG: CTP synthase [Patescibacteria group bacterium]
MKKYIFVAGGVMSGIGKGIATASIGRILKSKGFTVSAVKIDPYVNVDAGTMNPVEHGEVFVTKDGAECDQDIGNYERFFNQELTKKNYITTGKVYKSVIEKERNLEYDGKCVEVVPDIPNETIRRIKKAANDDNVEITLIEIGGTIGEYQNLLFLEAARMMKLEEPEKVLFILVSYLPTPKTIGEMKTKPTQNASRRLNEAGIQPDMILGRAETPLDGPRREKISNFCNVDKEFIISAPDVESIYTIPLNFQKENLGNKILKKFGLEEKNNELKRWKDLVKNSESGTKKVSIAIVGKYFETGQFTLTDSYISVIEAVKHASWDLDIDIDINWIFAEKFEEDEEAIKEIDEYDGIIIPGGFGSRGVEGKIKTISYCRKNNIPFLGLCLGMQLSVIEFARNICELKNANSTEFNNNCQEPVIDVMDEQKELIKKKNFGGTMRLGEYSCKIEDDSKSYNLYKKTNILERHRHRYEFNNEYADKLKKAGLKLAGRNPESNLVEIIEIEDHPFFVGVQFHPELKSGPLRPHPLFKGFLKASKER